MKRIVILTGAGVSKESGIETFRDDKNALWNNHNIDDVATIEGWNKNKEIVLKFYNERRKQLESVDPNEAHKLIAKLQDKFIVDVITQNIDNLHERAGSKKVLHLHGELTKSKSSKSKSSTPLDIGYNDINIGDLCPDGFQMRPNVVWFGEDVPKLQTAADLVYDADIVVVIGTSFTVYPAASLMTYAKSDAPVYIIDPGDAPLYSLKEAGYKKKKSKTSDGKYTHYQQPATVGMKMLFDELTSI